MWLISFQLTVWRCRVKLARTQKLIRQPTPNRGPKIIQNICWSRTFVSHSIRATIHPTVRIAIRTNGKMYFIGSRKIPTKPESFRWHIEILSAIFPSSKDYFRGFVLRSSNHLSAEYRTMQSNIILYIQMHLIETVLVQHSSYFGLHTHLVRFQMIYNLLYNQPL